MNYQSFEAYKQYIKSELIKLLIKGIISSLVDYFEIIGKMLMLDLTPVREIMKSQYSPKPRGSKPRDPVCMLRSLILMCLLKQTSITEWVDQMRKFSLYAILSGFSCDDVPGVGTFYDFIDRLTETSKQQKQKKRNRTKTFKSKPKKKYKRGEKPKEKEEKKHKKIVERIIQRLIGHLENPEMNFHESLLLQILRICFVFPSQKKGSWVMYPN